MWLCPTAPPTGLGRHVGQPLPLRQLPGQVPIGHGAAIGNLQQQFPHRLTEGGAQGVERGEKTGSRPEK